MQVTINKLPQSRVLLNIEVEAKKVSEAFNKAYKNLSKKTSVPGFRKGKVPRKILERVIGRDIISEEACNLILAETYPEAIKEVDIFPLGEPELDIKKLEEGNNMIFTAEVDVKPVLTLPDYKALQVVIDKDKYTVKDSHIEASLESLKERLAEPKEPGEEGLKKGNFVDLTIQIIYPHGEETDEKVDSKRKRIILNEDNLDGRIIKEIEGMKVDETREIILTEPSEEDVNSLKKVIYSVTLNSIMELPEFTPEFLEKHTNFKTLEELKEAFKKEWEKIFLDNKKSFIKENILANLVEKIEKNGDIEIPSSLLNTKVSNLMNTHIVQLAQFKNSLEDYLDQTGIQKKSIWKNSEMMLKTL